MRYDDESLVQACLSGDKEAFAFLVHEYQDVVYAYVAHKIGSRIDAEDITQEVFLKAYLNLVQLRWPHRFASWLYTIAHNECRMWLRKHHSCPVPLPLEGVHESKLAYEPASFAIPTQAAVDVTEALAQLSEDSRMTVSLFYLGGCSLKEISRFLGIPVNTVKVRLHRARQQLAHKLGDRWQSRVTAQKLSGGFIGRILERVGQLPPSLRLGILFAVSIVYMADLSERAF